MVNLSDEFKKLTKNKVPDKGLLIPLLTWVSGKRDNIEGIQRINKKLNVGKHNIYILELTYVNNVKTFLRYPKVTKLDDINSQYYKDLAHFYGWSLKELYKNLNVIDLEGSKKEISVLYAYEKSELKTLLHKR